MNPIHRNEALKPLSREHHQGLLLCWKIRTGFRKKIEISLMKSYADWFYRIFLLPHFDIEEKYVFSVLGNDHKLVKRALTEHRKLKRLFENENDVTKGLGLIEELLEAHIRFEERVLSNEIQKIATKNQLEEMELMHEDRNSHMEPEEWKYEFWK